MNLQDFLITTYAQNIKALPDKLQNQADWLKRQFDGRTDNEVKEQHNKLVQALVDLGAEETVASGDVRRLRLRPDGMLEYSTDGENFDLVQAGGHIVLDPAGGRMPARGKLQFAGAGTVEDIPGEDVTVVECLQGEPGAPGAVVDLSPGLFMMSIDGAGHLILTLNDAEGDPPLHIDENGHLIYTID